jgi:hypothetical protein
MKRKINMQQVSRTKLSTQQLLRTKNQHTTSSMNKISFKRRKINVQLSQREKINMKHFSRTKIITQQVPGCHWGRVHCDTMASIA